MMGRYRHVIKYINNSFVSLVLFIVYFPAIGLCFLLYLSTKLNTKKTTNNSYWIEAKPKQFTKEYFKSAY